MSDKQSKYNLHIDGHVDNMQVGDHNTMNINTSASNQAASPPPPAFEVKQEYRQPSDKSIFISYKREDWDTFVVPYLQKFEADGIAYWVDQQRLTGGVNFMDEINHALKITPLLLLFVSPEALESQWVKLEYRYFMTNQKPFIPVMCKNAELPPELLGYQYVKHDAYDRVKAAIQARLA